MKRSYIRIIATPPGEAPEEVRRAWVGLQLPLLLFHEEARDYRSAGVLTGPKGFLDKLRALFSGRIERKNGYAVVALQAIAVLEASNPEAAAWWRQNVPHALRQGKVFVFASEVCVVEADSSDP